MFDTRNDCSDKLHVNSKAGFLFIVIEIFILADFDLSQVHFTANVVPPLFLLKHGISDTSHETWLIFEAKIVKGCIRV